MQNDNDLLNIHTPVTQSALKKHLHISVASL